MKLIYIILFIAFGFVSCKQEDSEKVPLFDFGIGEYEEPFIGIFNDRPIILLKSLEYNPFKWLLSDTVVLSKNLIIDFNEESLRSHSKVIISFVDSMYQDINELDFFINNEPFINNRYSISADSLVKHIQIQCKIHPRFKNKQVSGFLIATGSQLDVLNSVALQQEHNIVANWRIEQKIGWPLILWLLWIITLTLSCILSYKILFFLFKGQIIYSYKKAIKISKSIRFRRPKIKKMKKEESDDWRARVKKKTNWSDTIITALNNENEANIYIAAGLKESKIGGRIALIRHDIDWPAFNCRKEWLKEKFANYDSWKDYNNADLISEGFPPRDSSGDPYELHHIGQHQDSPFAELTWKEHMDDGNNSILHPKRESEIDRQRFDKEKSQYWKDRFGLFTEADKRNIYGV